MKLSRRWLERYLKTSFSDEQLSDMLTIIGLETEGYESIEKIKGSLEGVVVGKVIECIKHPDADKLSLTKVDVGSEILQIVCGAPNVAVNQTVLVATPGTTLYTEDSSFQIKKTKIRGVESNGMICAEDELGLGSDHAGIMVLEDKYDAGTKASTLFDTGKDTIFEIGLTPNRSDATSQFGVARDLQAYIKCHHDGQVQLLEPGSSGFHINSNSQKIDISIENSHACQRYAGVIITDIKVGPSPEWVASLLRSIGVKPINNVVDVTNFILHELGQPLHAFDFDKIEGKKIIVKNLPQRTKFTALDNREFELRSEDLIICDGSGNAMCIGGVFGGKNTGVTDETNNVFLECAHFDATTIRRTSMHHNLRTDAAKAYEKGADPNIVLQALKRAAQYICDFTGGVVSSEIFDVYPTKILQPEIRLRYQKVYDIIGQEIDEDKIHNILTSLGMEISPVDDESIKVKVPTNKVDVLREIDLIEEILRIYGFNEIAIPSTVKSSLTYTSHPSKNDLKNRLANYLTALGFHEMMGMSLVEGQHVQDILGSSPEDLVFINNTSNVNLDVLRPDLIHSGLISVLHNLNRKQEELSLYEFGKTYHKVNEGFEERELMSLFLCGHAQQSSWNQKGRKYDFYDIKGQVQQMLAYVGIDGFQVADLEDQRFLYGLKYHRGPMVLASFGELHPMFLKDMGIKDQIYAAELDIMQLLSAAKKVQVSTVDISKYPQVIRDLALVIDEKVSFAEIETWTRKTAKSLLKDMTLFDIYKSEENLGPNKKSYAISLVFESIDKTLDEKEIDKVMSNLISTFESKLGAIIRK